jgi:hypothetical protein
MKKSKLSKKADAAHEAKLERAVAKTRTRGKYLRKSKSLAQRYQRLVQAIAAVSETRTRPDISHKECVEILDFYVDAELRGEQVNQKYPAAFEHLKVCTRCSLLYRLLADALADETERDLDLPTAYWRDLPFLAHEDLDSTRRK